ncbi:MAG: hypothetical protein KA184_11780 [Candidatus Hydrogenedentes bacterium]|nr:hypothetical protein [Candidatus Hydrogenedentota bacterium]
MKTEVMGPNLARATIEKFDRLVREAAMDYGLDGTAAWRKVCRENPELRERYVEARAVLAGYVQAPEMDTSTAAKVVKEWNSTVALVRREHQLSEDAAFRRCCHEFPGLRADFVAAFNVLHREGKS